MVDNFCELEEFHSQLKLETCKLQSEYAELLARKAKIELDILQFRYKVVNKYSEQVVDSILGTTQQMHIGE